MLAGSDAGMVRDSVIGSAAEPDATRRKAYLHAYLIIGWCAGHTVKCWLRTNSWGLIVEDE